MRCREKGRHAAARQRSDVKDKCTDAHAGTQLHAGCSCAAVATRCDALTYAETQEPFTDALDTQPHLEAAEEEDGVVAHHQRQELVSMLVDAVLVVVVVAVAQRGSVSGIVLVDDSARAHARVHACSESEQAAHRKNGATNAASE